MLGRQRLQGGVDGVNLIGLMVHFDVLIQPRNHGRGLVNRSEQFHAWPGSHQETTVNFLQGISEVLTFKLIAHEPERFCLSLDIATGQTDVVKAESSQRHTVRALEVPVNRGSCRGLDLLGLGVQERLGSI